MEEQKNKVIVVAGPTAAGKTRVAIDLAKHFGTEIISADSRQCYKELNIGVGRPSREELAQVPHHFIASHSIHEKQTAASFEAFALKKASEIFSRNNVVLLAGGTGLYINSFCEGLDEIPPIPEEVRLGISEAYKERGLAWLREEVKNIDPLFFEKGDIHNPHRLMRAFEVAKVTGESIFEFRKRKKKERPFHIIRIGLNLPKEQLHQNINRRVEEMMDKGWLEEIEAVLPYQHLNALQTVGYKELFAYRAGHVSLARAIEDIKKNTRQYAKRQLTWFRREKDYAWFDPEDKFTIFKFLKEQFVADQ
jgi:tRNA dimethylallyltransferase